MISINFSGRFSGDKNGKSSPLLAGRPTYSEFKNLVIWADNGPVGNGRFLGRMDRQENGEHLKSWTVITCLRMP